MESALLRRISRLVRHRKVVAHLNQGRFDHQVVRDGRRAQPQARAEGTNGRRIKVDHITFMVGIMPGTDTYRFLFAFIRAVVAVAVIVHVDVVDVDPSGSFVMLCGFMHMGRTGCEAERQHKGTTAQGEESMHERDITLTQQQPPNQGPATGLAPCRPQPDPRARSTASRIAGICSRAAS